MTSSTGAERAQDAASTAADRGQDVASTAADEARSVAGEAQQKARDVVGDARTQVAGHLDDQTRTQRDRLVTGLHGVGDDLDAMAGAGSGLASDLVRQAAQHTRDVTGWLDGRDPADLLDDVRGFARRRPGTFLLGALAAGVVVGRLARGARDAQQGGTGTGPTAGTAVAPTPAPPTPPAPPAQAGAPGMPVLPPEPVVPAAPAPPGPTPGSGLGTDAAGYGERPYTPGGPA